jgi:hypothetical protein
VRGRRVGWAADQGAASWGQGAAFELPQALWAFPSVPPRTPTPTGPTSSKEDRLRGRRWGRAAYPWAGPGCSGILGSGAGSRAATGRET